MPTQTRQPGTVTTATGPGTLAWSGTSNVAADDGSYASATLLAANAQPSGATDYSELLVFKGFGFTIPPGSTINSITAKLRRHCPENDDLDFLAYDNEVYQYYSAPTGSNLAAAGNWPASEAEETYSLSEPLATVINASEFGFCIAVQLSNFQALTAVDVQALIDLAEITVDYTPGDPLPSPPPFPGSGGLNTGGAFFAMMVNQQRGG